MFSGNVLDIYKYPVILKWQIRNMSSTMIASEIDSIQDSISTFLEENQNKQKDLLQYNQNIDNADLIIKSHYTNQFKALIVIQET